MTLPDTTISSNSPSTGLPRVLLADDNPVIISLLTQQLSDRFEVVDGAQDAEEAISMAEEHQPDAVIIDVQMPKGGGLRATEEIHKRVPHAAIVALSGDESRNVVLSMLDRGAIAYLRKGLPKEELISTVQRAIDAHSGLAASS